MLRVPSVTLGEPYAEIAVLDDGVDVFLRVGDLVATTEGQLVVDTETLDLTGTLDARASAYARFTVRKDAPSDEVAVDVVEVDVAIESVDGTFASPEAAAVFRLAAGVLRTTLEAQLRDVIGGVIGDVIPPVLSGVLSGIDHALEGVSVAIDQPPLPAIELRIDGRMSRIEPRYRDALAAPLSLSVSVPSASLHPGSRGVARAALDPDALAETSLGDAPGRIGVRLGVLNALLHVLWDAGLLDLDLTPLLPDSVSGLVSEPTLTPLLPPIVRPTRTGEDEHDLVLSLGELELELVYDGARARFGVRADAGVDVSLSASTLRMELAEDPAFHVWPIDVPDEATILTPELVEEVLRTLWPDLRASLADGLSFAIPIPPLTALDTVAPDLAGLSLSLDENRSARPAAQRRRAARPRRDADRPGAVAQRGVLHGQAAALSGRRGPRAAAAARDDRRRARSRARPRGLRTRRAP